MEMRAHSRCECECGCVPVLCASCVCHVVCRAAVCEAQGGRLRCCLCHDSTLADAVWRSKSPCSCERVCMLCGPTEVMW